MPSSRVRLKSPLSFGPTGAALLRTLFALAAIIAAFSTYTAVTSSGNAGATTSPVMIWLLAANLIIILVLGAALAARILRLYRENRETGGGAKLQLRIIALFAIAAMVPTLIVAGFLGTLINRSVESWFSERVYSVVESATEAARASLDAVHKELLTDLNEVEAALNDPTAVQGFSQEPERYQEFLWLMAATYDLPSIFLLRSDGTVAFSAEGEGAPPFRAPEENYWAAVRNGQIANSDYEISNGHVLNAFTKLSAYDGVYLYVARFGPKEVAAQLRANQAALNAYREADNRKNSLRNVFVLAYLETAFLVLLGTAWLGMSAAARIAEPIGELAVAARTVRDGDLTARINRPKEHDEIDDLATAFNEMTSRLSRQTEALDTARIEAENRTAFIETVLAGVEAGVLRIDAAFVVTLANDSAARLLGQPSSKIVGSSVTDVAPEFVPILRKSMSRDRAEGGNVRLEDGDNHKDIHVRISPETEENGFVFTFHDTTRLVAGQRQAAWRDVARRIAHEIRNPLTPIQLSAERLKRRFTGQIEKDQETFERCTNTILRQVGDIGRMVEEFSSFARMPKPTLARFDVGELAQGIAFGQRLAAPAVNFTIDMPETPIEVTGDERLLGQALTNVIKNASESVDRAVRSGTTKSGAISIVVDAHEDMARISIMDTGVGFPKKDRERLLEPYVTTRESGVGLGLAIVNRIVEDHGGSLELGDNETAGHGAKVVINLPVTQSEQVESLAEVADEGVSL